MIEQAGHDGLAGARIVREQEAQRLARQHLAVDGGDLVRQRLDLRSADGQVGIEQMGEPDAIGLGGQPQQAAVGIERVAATRFHELEAALLAAIDKAFADSAVDPKDEVRGIGAETRDLDDLRDPSGIETAQARSGLDVLECTHSHYPQRGSIADCAGKDNRRCSLGEYFAKSALSRPPAE